MCSCLSIPTSMTFSDLKLKSELGAVRTEAGAMLGLIVLGVNLHACAQIPSPSREDRGTCARAWAAKTHAYSCSMHFVTDVMIFLVYRGHARTRQLVRG